MWTDSFSRLLSMVNQANGSLLTLLGIDRKTILPFPLHPSHNLYADQSFSDFPLLAPTSPFVALEYLATVHQLSTAFLRGELAQAPSIIGKEPDGGKLRRDNTRNMIGEKGEVIVHLLGPQ